MDRTPPPRHLFEQAVPARPVRPLASHFSASDYPALAIRERRQGLVEFALRVARDGRPSGCSVLNQGTASVLEIATCDILLRRARFEPARDSGGQAVEGAVRGRIKWALPPPPPIPDRMMSRHRIRADGSMSDCVVKTLIGNQVRRRESASCERMDTPSDVLTAIRGQSAAPEPHVRTEFRLLRSADEPWPDFARRGERVLARSYARLVVEEGGKVGRCTVVETMTLLGRAPTPCRSAGTVDPRGLSLPSEVRIAMAVILEEGP